MRSTFRRQAIALTRIEFAGLRQPVVRGQEVGDRAFASNRDAFGQRLRYVGVSEGERVLLLGHAISSMPRHHPTATITCLVEAANKMQETRDHTTLLRVVNG